MKETMGQVIRRLRKGHDITQEELADALGVTAQAVSKWENDVGIPDVSLLVPLANLFDVSIDTLFSREGQSTDVQVSNFLEELEQKNLTEIKKFEILSEELRKYPNHPDLIKSIVRTAFLIVSRNNSEESHDVLIRAIKAVDTFIRHCDETGQVLLMQAEKIDLLSHAGCYSEAEILAREFDDYLYAEKKRLLARIFRQKKDFSEEIHQRQENIAFLLTFLMGEISELGMAYEMNESIEDALHVHSINLKLPYFIHENAQYHALIQNSHFLSGFNAAYCLVQLERYEEAVDVLEKIFDYAEIQCECSRNHVPLVSPLLNGIDMEPFHGEMWEDDYLFRIKNENFSSLHNNPRFQTLLERFDKFQKRP